MSKLESKYNLPNYQIYIHHDSNLIWEELYNYICKKISEKIGVLKYIRDYMTFDILKLVYNSIVLPHMDYAFVGSGRYAPIWLTLAECLNCRKEQQELF